MNRRKKGHKEESNKKAVRKGKKGKNHTGCAKIEKMCLSCTGENHYSEASATE